MSLFILYYLYTNFLIILKFITFFRSSSLKNKHSFTNLDVIYNSSEALSCTSRSQVTIAYNNITWKKIAGGKISISNLNLFYWQLNKPPPTSVIVKMLNVSSPYHRYCDSAHAD